MLMRSTAVAGSDGEPWLMPRISQKVRHELLRYADHPVALHERLLLLTCLDDYGSLPLDACLHVLRGSDNPVAVLAVLILRGVITADLHAESLDPTTRIRRAETVPARAEECLP